MRSFAFTGLGALGGAVLALTLGYERADVVNFALVGGLATGLGAAWLPSRARRE